MFDGQSAKGPWKGVDVGCQLILCFRCGELSTLSAPLKITSSPIPRLTRHRFPTPHLMEVLPTTANREQTALVRAHNAHVNKKKGRSLFYLLCERTVSSPPHFSSPASIPPSLFLSTLTLFPPSPHPAPPPTLSIERQQPQRYLQDDRR